MKFMWNNIYDHFRRKTNTTAFIPQIDGLRFLAIFMVVLFHINIFVTNKIPFTFSQSAKDYWLYNFLNTDRKGVLLFFVISGFILALPFIKESFGQEKPVELKKYYLRRLTRLEPPYFLVMIASFLGVLLLPSHGFISESSRTFANLFPSLAASLVYLHNLIFSQNLSLNPVAWSLEIEVQFYLIVPLLVRVFKFSPVVRRTILSTAILGFVFLQHQIKPGFYSLYNYIQYFLLGLLLADLYLSQIRVKINFWLAIFLGLISLGFIWLADVRTSPYVECLFVAFVFMLYFLALTCEAWIKVFSIRPLVIIGGMCYTIYLLHYNLISLVGNKTIFFNVSRSYPAAYLWHSLILIPIILLVSAVFYLLIERPCMDKDWPVKLWRWVKNLINKKTPPPVVFMQN